MLLSCFWKQHHPFTSLCLFLSDMAFRRSVWSLPSEVCWAAVKSMQHRLQTATNLQLNPCCLLASVCLLMLFGKRTMQIMLQNHKERCSQAVCEAGNQAQCFSYVISSKTKFKKWLKNNRSMSSFICTVYYPHFDNIWQYIPLHQHFLDISCCTV